MSKKTRLSQDLRRRMLSAGTCERSTIRIRQGKPTEVHLSAVVNSTTLKSYKASIRQFSDYCVSKGLYWSDLMSMDTTKRKRLIEDYEYDVLEANNYTAATIHTKLAPVCRALDVDMSLIAKPTRGTAKIVRGVVPEANSKGKKELDNPKYARLIEFQRRVGIRRDELAHLRKNYLIVTRSGVVYVVVRRGKGGKCQRQWIKPADADFIRGYFDGTDNAVFEAGEIPPHADLHSLRAQHAQDMYDYFAAYLARHPDRRDGIKQMLIDYAKRYGSAKNIDAVRKELDKPTEYKLRGDVARLAKLYGKPVVLDRTAIMCASVLALAHWRANVTVTNYLVKPSGD